MRVPKLPPFLRTGLCDAEMRSQQRPGVRDPEEYATPGVGMTTTAHHPAARSESG